MQEQVSSSMETPNKIIRRSIHTFLQHYHQFTTFVSFLVFPAAAAILLSQSVLSSSPVVQSLTARIRSVFESAGFPLTSPFFSLLSVKLSQTFTSSIFTLPFAFSFLLFAKSSVILSLSCRPVSSFLHLYRPLFLTQLFNFIIILSANSGTLAILFLAFNSFEALGFTSPHFTLFLSASGAVLYSIVLANAVMICNLAVIVAGMENCSGWLAILKACVLMRGKAATALSLALPTNLTLAAIEALFQYRVVKAYHLSEKFNLSFTWEAPLIVYIYSIMIVLDTVMSCVFYRTCRLRNLPDLDFRICNQKMENTEENNNEPLKYAETLQEIP